MKTKDRTYLFIARTRTYPTFWPSFVRTYLPTPTDLFGFLNIDFTKKLPKIVFFLKFTTMDIVYRYPLPNAFFVAAKKPRQAKPRYAKPRYASQSIEKKICQKNLHNAEILYCKIALCKFFQTSSKNRVIQIRAIENRVSQGIPVVSNSVGIEIENNTILLRTLLLSTILQVSTTGYLYILKY